MTDIIRSVDELIAGNLMQSMGRSKGAIDEVKQRVASEINDNVNRVKEALTSSGKAMQQLAAKIDKELASVSRDAGDLTDEHLQTADKYLREYGEYRYYVGLGISSLLLLILICVICGLLCGICGKRPDGYGDDCCNKGAGGRFLMMYVRTNTGGFVITFNEIHFYLQWCRHHLLDTVRADGVCASPLPGRTAAAPSHMRLVEVSN